MAKSNRWQLFTRGPLFEAVQSLRLFRDSKTFPDMIPREFDLEDDERVAEVLATFVQICQESFLNRLKGFQEGLDELSIGPDENYTLDRLKQVRGLGKGVIDFRSRMMDFITEHFHGRTDSPFAKGQRREPTCSMEAYIDGAWENLRRDNRNLPQEMFNGTLIQMNFPHVVAGGRFDEVYYWDGYFTGVGLVLSGGLDLFHGMIKNNVVLILENGFVPNGNRKYYLTRSQPPVLYCMVDLLGKLKGQKFLAEKRFTHGETKVSYLDVVQLEYQFWMGQTELGSDRCVTLPDGVVLNRYWDHYSDKDLQPHVQPRPEAYHEDIENYSESAKGTDAAEFFRHVRAAAESGWDFSSRWFRPDPVGWRGGIRRSMSTIRTTDILPVDLNALLFGVERKLYDWTGDPAFQEAAARRKDAIIKYCWNEELGWFFDYCNANEHSGQTDIWSLAGAYPLFSKMLDPITDKGMIDQMEQTIRTRFLRAGGVVTTLYETGQQWDYPNGWAPLHWIVVRGLMNYGRTELALDIAKRFVRCVGRTYLREGRIMEKYNVCEPDEIAGGGEYIIQQGFGWTNGVVKAFMVEFRNEFELDPTLKAHLG